jgi:TolB-like protein/tetratricopeptide (TPR) repeat protein
MANFLAELKRRNIYRVGALYLVVAWVLLQLIANVAPILELPPWVARAFLLLLVIGFPLAILLAWTREPEGDPTQRAMTGRLDWALMGALVVVIALVMYQQFAPPRIAETQQASVAAARLNSAAQDGAISIAVLPFVNLSSDAEQEFFSDGMTEEITTALAKIPDLRVVGRTSAFQFKGRSQDLRAIGQALSATHLLEGSVRKEGNRLRITAQLIQSENGVHVWAENYDRELTGVFAIQEDIATAIAGALRTPLGLKPGERLVSSRTNNLEAYQEFLRLRAEFRARGVSPNFLPDLEKLVARNPSFAPAWGLLAIRYVTIPSLDFAIWSRSAEETRRLVQGGILKSEQAAREAIRLDPKLAIGYGQLAYIETSRHNLVSAEDLIRQALALDPNDPDLLGFQGSLLARMGRLNEAVAFAEQARALEPLVPIYSTGLGHTLLANGKTDAAIKILEANRPTRPPGQISFRNEILARAYAAAGRYTDAAETILAIVPQTRYGDGGQLIVEAARLMRGAPLKTVSESLPVLPGRLNFVYAYVGAPDRMMEYPERALEVGLAGSTVSTLMFEPLMAPVRKTDRFKKWARTAGLVDYWRERGWPEFCRPVGADDFVCD